MGYLHGRGAAQLFQSPHSAAAAPAAQQGAWHLHDGLQCAPALWGADARRPSGAGAEVVMLLSPEVLQLACTLATLPAAL